MKNYFAAIDESGDSKGIKTGKSTLTDIKTIKIN